MASSTHIINKCNLQKQKQRKPDVVACICNARTPAAHGPGDWVVSSGPVRHWDKKQGEWSPRNSTWGCPLASTYTHIQVHTLTSACAHTHTNSRKTYIYFYITCFYSLSHFINLFAHIFKGKQKVLTQKVSGLRLLKNAVFFQSGEDQQRSHSRAAAASAPNWGDFREAGPSCS